MIGGRLDGCGWMYMDVDVNGCGWMWMDVDGLEEDWRRGTVRS